MSDISPVARTYAPEYATPAPATRLAAAPTVRRGQDQVSLSDSARIFASVKENPVREGLVASVKAEIAAGTYETDEKINAAVDAAFADLT